MFRDYLKNMHNRFYNVGTWENESDIFYYVYFMVALFVVPFYILSYILSSLIATKSVQIVPWHMDEIHKSLCIFFFVSMFFAIVIVSQFIIGVYKRLIYKPVTEFNKELANMARSEVSEYYTNGKMSQPFRDPTSAISWEERVRYYIDSAASDKYIDELTGCFNRKYFANKFSKYMHLQLIAKGRTSSTVLVGDDEYAVFMIDIDHFKAVNDDYGHAAGDEVLKSVGKLLRETVGDNGVVIRNGGEEFVVVYLAKHPFDFSLIAEKINQAFRDKIKVVLPTKGIVRNVTCSIGYVRFPIYKNAELIFDLQAHIDMSDSAMYLSKTNGRDRWHEIKCLREVTDKIDSSLYVNDPEYGLRRGYYVIRNRNGECSDLSNIADIE